MQGVDRNHPSLTPAQRELEDALRGLAPADSAIDRDRLLFQAGALAVRRRTTYLRWAVGALAAGLALALLLRPEPRVIERVVVRSPSTTPSPVKVAGADRKDDVSPKPNPGPLAGASRLPLPVPGGPFVTMPPGYVSVASFQPAGDTRTSAYLGKIQGVLQKGLNAIPGTRNWRRGQSGHTATKGSPLEDAPPTAPDDAPPG